MRSLGPTARWFLAGLLIVWFYHFIPTSDSLVFLLATVWLVFMLAGILGRQERDGDRG